MYKRGDLVMITFRTALDYGEVGIYEGYVSRTGCHQIKFVDDSTSLYPRTSFRLLSPLEHLAWVAKMGQPC